MKSGWFYRAFDVAMDLLILLCFVLAALFMGACVVRFIFN